MNGILGYLRLDGQPIETGKIEAMNRAMEFWGVHGDASWQEGPIGLGCRYCFCTPETVEKSLPFHDDERGLVFTAGAFLDNRDELLDELDIAPECRPTLPDTLLIHRAYVKWGEECVHHLTGDWHFALWDRRKRKLFLARDHHGNTSVYYTQGPGFFAFGSGKKAFWALPEVSRSPNLLRIAQVLTSWPGDGIQTSYEGIFRLPPAHCLRIEDGKIAVERYWFAEEAPILRFPREEDYLDAFLEQYDRAVRVRLRSNSRVGATLSGGLDSGSVSVLAARHLREKGERLAAFTSVPMVDVTSFTAKHRFGDESEFAEATAAHAGNIDVTWLRSEGVSPLKGIEWMLEVHDEPGHAAGNQYWMFDLFDVVRSGSMRVLLTGQGGNATVSWPGGAVNLLPLLLPRNRSEFRPKFLDLQKRQGLSFVACVKRFIIGPLVNPLRRHVQYGGLSGKPPFLSYSTIHPRFAEIMQLGRLMRERGHDPFFRTSLDPLATRYLAIRPGRMDTGARWSESGGASGVEVRDPTVDKRLMEFCLGIPDVLHFAEGMDRAVIRRAFKGFLPDEVRLNRKRGFQAADIVVRVQQNLPGIKDVLRRMDGHGLCKEVLDLPRMRRVLDSVGQTENPASTRQCRSILLRGLGAGLFLMRF